MIWVVASSLLIHNTGLPVANILQFAMVLIGLSVGWIVIKFHEAVMAKKAADGVKLKYKNGFADGDDLNDLLNKEKGIVAANKTFRERMLSWKTLHGVAMTISWANLAPRLFASNQSGDFSCHTYPVEKPINTARYTHNGNLTFVPENSPSYERVPWANREALWVSLFFVVPLVFSLVIGSSFAFRESKKNAKIVAVA
jgi:hypothetical protein